MHVLEHTNTNLGDMYFNDPPFHSVRVTRETDPEVIDKLQCRKLELEVEIHG